MSDETITMDVAEFHAAAKRMRELQKALDDCIRDRDHFCEKVSALHEGLKRLEWCIPGKFHGERIMKCPACDDPQMDYGHTYDCWLAKLLEGK